MIQYVALACLSLAVPTIACAECQLEVTVEQTHGGAPLALAVFDSAERFARYAEPIAAVTLPPPVTLQATLQATLPVTPPTAAFQLPPGRYAVAVFQDDNRNGRLDSNLIGIPIEAYGFSGSAGLFGPPDFETASVLCTGSVQVTITL